MQISAERQLLVNYPAAELRGILKPAKTENLFALHADTEYTFW